MAIRMHEKINFSQLTQILEEARVSAEDVKEENCFPFDAELFSNRDVILNGVLENSQQLYDEAQQLLQLCSSLLSEGQMKDKAVTLDKSAQAIRKNVEKISGVFDGAVEGKNDVIRELLRKNLMLSEGLTVSIQETAKALEAAEKNAETANIYRESSDRYRESSERNERVMNEYRESSERNERAMNEYRESLGRCSEKIERVVNEYGRIIEQKVEQANESDRIIKELTKISDNSVKEKVELQSQVEKQKEMIKQEIRQIKETVHRVQEQVNREVTLGNTCENIFNEVKILAKSKLEECVLL